MAKRMALILILVLVAGMGQQYAYSRELPLAMIGESNLSRQQKVNRATLLSSPDEQIRIDAAVELLLAEERSSRAILLNILTQGQNVEAQIAVCKALAQSRGLNFKDRRDFFEPLFGILITGSDSQAKATAEALVIFEYKSIAEGLEGIIANGNISLTAKLNAIYALKLRPEKPAIFELIKLVGNSNKDVASGAALALQDTLGIPVGTELSAWDQIVRDLEKKSPDEFVRDRLVRQEIRVHQLETQMTSWQGLYLSSLDILYDQLKEDNDKAAFLRKRLNSDELVIQMWALEQVSKWRLGSKSLPPSFGPVLVSLVSSSEAALRLEAAKILALTSYFNPAEQILNQLQVEREEAIKLELLGALGSACSYAKLNPDVKVPDAVHTGALDWAGKFIQDSDARKAQKGAEVLGKLLGCNGLTQSDAEKYLSLFVGRYQLEKQKSEPDDNLRAAMLTEMAGLCGANTHRAEAAKLFEPLFLQALGEANSVVRSAAVNGLTKVDEPRALATFIQKKLTDDGEPKIRTSVIELAGKVGSKEDLAWLAAKVQGSGEPEAWKAMIDIFKRSNAAILADWVSRLDIPGGALAADKTTTLLEMTEQKADGENKTEIALAARKRLAQYYKQTKQTEKAVKYYGMLVENSSGEERDRALAGLLGAQLESSQFEAVTQLMSNRLIEKDLDPNDEFVSVINAFLNGRTEPGKRSGLLKALESAKSSTSRSLWRKQVESWKSKYSEPNGPVARKKN